MMQYKGYIGKVEFDPEAKVLHGEVVGIRDVVTFQGDSIKEIEKAFRESVDDYLAFCNERGEEPGKPFSGQFILRVTPELHRHLSMLAEVSGVSLNGLVAECLGREVEAKLSLASTKSRQAARPISGRKAKAVGGKRASAA
jgi:predicted HicB family RNase H-like nuclease